MIIRYRSFTTTQNNLFQYSTLVHSYNVQIQSCQFNLNHCISFDSHVHQLRLYAQMFTKLVREIEELAMKFSESPVQRRVTSHFHENLNFSGQYSNIIINLNFSQRKHSIRSSVLISQRYSVNGF